MIQQNQEQNEKKYNYFYKITNLINGKFYYGIHSTNNLEDGYMGGGKLIREAIKKHGKENFQKEIVANCLTRKEVSDHEKLVVTMDLVLDENCYNLKTGGDNESVHSEETRKLLSKANKGKKISKETRDKMSTFQKGRIKTEIHRKRISVGLLAEKHPMFGKFHSEETLKKMSEAHSGEKNHWFGKFNCNPLSKQCNIMGIIYESMAEASRQLNVKPGVIRSRILSTTDRFKDWKYVE